MHRQGLTALGAVAALALVACGSSSGTGGGGSTSSSTGSAASAAPSSSSGSAGSIRVDLTITGALTATLQGTKGRCDLSKTIGNEVVLEASDYPDLGPGGVFQLSWGGTTPPTIKIVAGSGGFLSGADVSGIAINPEGTIVRLDQTVSGGAGGGSAETTMVTGQVSCA